MENIQELLQSVLMYCKERTTDTAYKLWIEPIQISEFQGNTAKIFFSNEFKKNTVVSQYDPLIREALEAVCGFPVEPYYYSPQTLMNEEDIEKNSLLDFKNDIFTFDNFIVGNSNKFAYTAAKAIAADPGGQINKQNSIANYNPLFIYGNSGLGKTHLLNAISNQIKLDYPEMNVVYVTCEDFLNEFMSVLYNKKTEEFREKYRNIDVFLVDDIQFIAGKESTEWEFFHTFNALVDNGKQVVLTSDRPPKDIKSIIDRLRGRFESGLIVDIQIPEYETRCAIIKRKAQLLNFNIPENVINYIAERIKSNIRQLEGITKKLHAMCTYGEETPTIALAQAAIKDVLNDVQPVPITINRIVDEVSRTTGVSVEDIYSKKHTAEVSDARKMCFYIVREVTNISYEDIGKEFNRNHSTVMYNVRTLGDTLKQNSTLNSQVLDIINNIKDYQ
ncbi:MAG: chromosomal replication initiator protein DnaA [Eubacterium sp.]|nr:chromosomal replication initiator protein DnaA [Eubacterium sp.]MBR1532341.1 chromosomal replication initiator protein DnaA [Eubacterium sp.]